VGLSSPGVAQIGRTAASAHGVGPSIATVPGARHFLVPLTVGTRVVVRHSLAGDQSPPWSDLLGELLAQDSASLTVSTASGPVTVARAAVVGAKPVPPAPVRRARSARPGARG